MFPADIPYPDIGAKNKPERNFERVEFGDGYFQLVTRGINDLKITRQLSWKLTKDEGLPFYDWLESVLNKEFFVWAYPGDKERKYLCTDLDMTDNDVLVQISATFEEVFLL